jgi:hypothetical protein
LKVRQQLEDLRIVHASTNEELDMIAESMDLLWGQTCVLEMVTNALSAKARKPSLGLEGVKEPASDPRFAAGVSTAPLSPDAAYIGLVLPTPEDMRAGRLVDDDDALPPDAADDEEGLCASVH